MHKDYQALTLKSRLLLYLFFTGELILDQYSKGSIRRAIFPDAHQHFREKTINQSLRRLFQKGYIKTEYKESKRIIKLTKKGQLHALFEKSKNETFNKKEWDGSWTIVSFDVPENARAVRKQLRKLLNEYEYKILQASVYISPQPFPDGGYAYLKYSKLDRYITIFTARKISASKTFRKKFGLS